MRRFKNEVNCEGHSCSDIKLLLKISTFDSLWFRRCLILGSSIQREIHKKDQYWKGEHCGKLGFVHGELICYHELSENNLIVHKEEE